MRTKDYRVKPNWTFGDLTCMTALALELVREESPVVAVIDGGKRERREDKEAA